MSLDVVREAMKVIQVVGEDTTQRVVENDIIVPDIKPDIARILLLDGDVFVNSTEIAQDRVLVNGTIRYKILYISDDEEQSIKSINTNAAFSYGLDIPNSRQGMKCKVKCDIEHFDYEILNGRKINVRAILKLNGKVTNGLEQSFINDIAGIEDIQVLRNSYNFNCYLGRGESSSTIREAMEIPPGKPAIREILRNDIKISNKDYKITDDKVIVKGEVNVSTLYIGDDEERSVQFMEHEVPFTQFVDMPGIDEDARVEVDYNIVDTMFDAEENSDGELRTLKGEIVLDFIADGFTKKAIEIIADAYSPHSRINLESEPFKVEEIVEDNKSQIVLKDTVTVDDGSPDIAEVFNVLCKPVLSEYNIVDDKIIIEGLVNNNVLYLANNSEQPIFCYEQDIPIRHTVDVRGIKPGMSCEIELDIEHCNYSMISSNEVELRLVVGANARVIKQISLPLIGKVNESLLDDKRAVSQPSITIYFSQPGDNLWKIAKKYLATMDEIRKANNLADTDLIKPGQQIYIPRRAT